MTVHPDVELMAACESVRHCTLISKFVDKRKTILAKLRRGGHRRSHIQTHIISPLCAVMHLLHSVLIDSWAHWQVSSCAVTHHPPQKIPCSFFV